MSKTQNTNRGSNGNHGSKWIRPEKRLAIYLRDGFACAYCGRDLAVAGAAEVTLDHLVPRSEDGGHEAANLVTVCLSCNSSRGNKSWMDYATGGAIERIVGLVCRPLNMELAKNLLSDRRSARAVKAEAAGVET
jgi:hypothetical protein